MQGTALQLSQELARANQTEEENSFKKLKKLLEDTQAKRNQDKTCSTKFANQDAEGIKL